MERREHLSHSFLGGEAAHLPHSIRDVKRTYLLQNSLVRKTQIYQRGYWVKNQQIYVTNLQEEKTTLLPGSLLG